MATTNMKTMREFFDFGFEQVKAVSVTTKENNFTADANEFAKGGKFEHFANYTRERFEREFQVCLMFL